MNQLGPFAALIGLAAVILAGLGALVAWWNEETRRMTRGLRKVLGEAPHALLIAPGRGRGVGFNFTSNTMAVAWDGGGWCLIYHIDELIGVELLVDGHVAARTWRGEARRPLENVGGAERQVALRLVFDDPHHPDFGLELWSATGTRSRRAPSAVESVEEGNRWIARTESVFRRKPAPMPVRVAPQPQPQAVPPPPVEPPPAPVAAPRQELPLESSAPWDDDEDEDDSAAL